MQEKIDRLEAENKELFYNTVSLLKKNIILEREVESLKKISGIQYKSLLAFKKIIGRLYWK